MPFIRFLASKHYTLLAVFISLDNKIISPYSYYIKKGLVYIIIIAFFNWQPSFYFKCTKVYIYSFCNIYLVSVNKYIFLIS